MATKSTLSLLAAVAALSFGIAQAQSEMGTVSPPPTQNNSGAFAPVVPRELVLTFAEGEYAEPVKSAVTLSCTSNAGVPAPQGTHPEPAQACLDLEMANATLAGLPKDPNAICPMIYQPVTVTISGTWNGKLVSERATYGNRCELAHKTGTVFLEWPFRVY